MEQRGWDQTTLAKKAELSDAAVSRHLEKKTAPRLSSVEAYCRALEVALEWLAYGRGPMVATSKSEPRTEVMLGSAALEVVLQRYEWPADFSLDDADAVTADVRSYARASGQDRPESIWKLQIDKAVRERQGRTKSVVRRASATDIDLSEESPEVTAGRKRQKRA